MHGLVTNLIRVAGIDFSFSDDDDDRVLSTVSIAWLSPSVLKAKRPMYHGSTGPRSCSEAFLPQRYREVWLQPLSNSARLINPACTSVLDAPTATGTTSQLPVAMSRA